MTLYRLTVVRTGATLGRARVDAAGHVTDTDGPVATVFQGVIRRGGVEALDGWTNGYVQVKKA